jgi:hypothetical protein
MVEDLAADRDLPTPNVHYVRTRFEQLATRAGQVVDL